MKDLTDAIRGLNETFARVLNEISSSMSTVAQSLARSFGFMSQRWCLIITISKDTIHQTFKTFLVYKVIINKLSHCIIILTVHLMNLDTLVVEIHQWIMKTTKVVQHTNNYSKSIHETGKLLHSDIMFFFSLLLKALKKNNMGFSSIERFLMEFALLKK